MRTPIAHAKYTCSNSGLIVEIIRIRYRGEGYTKAWLRYFLRASGTFFREEKNVRLEHSQIQHWERLE